MNKKTVEVIGRACRLPGANNVAEFWDLLISGTCSVDEIGPDRFSTFRYLHPLSGQEGKAYTFRAGVLDDVWGFDPTVFSLSPREALQMDPQQRLLLMLVWEALEEAGVPASQIAGTNTGVFVGNSGSDHANRFFFDPASSDSFMMTGNTTSLVSNRISYIYDLHGPSFTVDTACSSSLVALDLALKRLQSGEIDTAIVAGVNMLLSPFPFVGFSAASMLSPQGLCRPFDENANGYVRAEGAVVLVLQNSDAFNGSEQKSYGRIVEAGINSDGRTSGVALPSSEFQAELLEKVYKDAAIHPDQLAFIEAHGTGTRVGDPAETFALGKVLGRERKEALPIGSVKSNVGHLEPASGMVSVLKSLLALEHDMLPPSLHIVTPNPDIPFDDLNLSLTRKASPIERGDALRYAGVNNFGFGGTNAHVLVSDSEQAFSKAKAAKTKAKSKKASVTTAVSAATDAQAKLLVLSARSPDALRSLAKGYAQKVEADDTASVADWGNAVAWKRDLMDERLAVVANSREELGRKLSDFAEDKGSEGIASGSAARAAADPVFVFSGNGSQFAGMGQEAYRLNPVFKAQFEAVDALFEPISGWSLTEKLFSDDLKEALKSTSIAQPLLFALQVAITEALRQNGLSASGVVGHSVGEVAAAWACGALSLEQAVKVIYVRSHHQEAVRGAGKMAVIKLSEEDALAQIEASGFEGVEISAINTATSLTLSGPTEALQSFMKTAKKKRLPGKLLDIEYPFHSKQIDPIEKGIIEDLSGIKPKSSAIPFFSSVSGAELDGAKLDGGYWWNNVRKPVHFFDAIQTAFKEGRTQFIEIGPRPILKGYVSEIARDEGQSISVIESLQQKTDGSTDPVLLAVGRAIVNGAAFDRETVFGAKAQSDVALLPYPWQIKPFKIDSSSEAFEIFNSAVAPHALLGQQLRPDDHVWDTELDTALIPYLSDHKVDGKVILPGAAFAEMCLSAAKIAYKTDQVELRDMDLLQALQLSDDKPISVRTRLDDETGVVEIFSRKRLVDDEWQLHTKCRVAKIPGDVGLQTADHNLVAPVLGRPIEKDEIEALYQTSRDFGLDFGPSFQRMVYCERFGDDYIELELDERAPTEIKRELVATPYALHPLDFDASFHGLNCLYEDLDTGPDKMAFIPVRFGSLRVYQDATPIRTARIHVIRHNNRGIQADINLFAADGTLVAALRDGRFRSSALVQRQGLDRLTYSYDSIRVPAPSQQVELPALDIDQLKTAIAALPAADRQRAEDGQLLLQAAARRGAYDVLKRLADETGLLSPHALPELAALDGLEDGAAQEDLRARNDHRLKLVHTLINICEQSGLAEALENGWQLRDESDMPDVDVVLQLLLTEDPKWAAECVMLNHALSTLPSELVGMDRPFGDCPLPHNLYSQDLYDQHFSSSPLAEAHVEQVASAVGAVLDRWPQGRPLRVLEFGIGGASLTKALLPMVERLDGRLISVDTNKLIVDRLQILFARSIHFRTLAIKDDLSELAALEPFDLVVSANGLQMMDGASDLLPGLKSVMAKDGVLIASLTDSNVFQDITFGMADTWFVDSLDPANPASAHANATDWQGWITDAGLASVSLDPFVNKAGEPDLTGAYLLVGSNRSSEVAEVDEEASSDKRECLILVNKGSKVEETFAKALVSTLADPDGFEVTQITLSAKESEADHETRIKAIAQAAKGGALDLICLAGAFDASKDPMASLSPRLKCLAGLIRDVADLKLRLWIPAPGGFPHVNGHAIDPVQSGVWAFGRTASNEYGNQDIRLVDFSGDLSSDQQAVRLAQTIVEPGEEREILLEPSGMRVMRAVRGVSKPATKPQERFEEAACKLHHPRSGSLDRLSWIPVKRRLPGPGEVEIEVVGTGLNFRDVMWAQGLLPEEALEDGFAGPTLGFECSGRIVRIGKGVDRFKIGDPVMALAPACFASHVTVVETGVSRLPDSMDLTAAATMPVAFLTSYYALHYLAQLEEDEWVLIHGAAGAVGLAALQIAKWRGARVIATAGNPEKREFLKLLGADHVLDTRSLNFVDEVRAITRAADGPGREGVDVVLNSLFGEAMERSLELVRPFGRFLELGKRDFYGNTKIGLRPFRRNISYFGIDADQLLNHQPKRARRLFSELSELFEEEQFSLLPYRLFESDDIVDAFRLMQRSGHIGKIVVKAPVPSELPAEDAGLKVAAEGHHVIVGGLGGFGLETAAWLADQGATSVVLTGRSGKMNDDAKALQKRLAAKGCTLSVKACDVTDMAALKAMLDELRKEAPIKGIMHSAVVLDDILIANMSDAQIDAVLEPKVVGGENLDQATRDDQLDYFWLFSSVSVLMGNPGQSNYVAANAYLDGLARRRLQEGLPALSIGWGPITDVGILARDTQTAEILAKTTGGAEFKARQALDRLAEFIAEQPSDAQPATITIAPMNWGFAVDNLAVLKTPAYELLAREAAQSSNRDQQAVDVATLIDGLDDVAARTEIAKILAQEVAAIFRMPVEEVQLNRSLSDIGMDSLMGMELRSAAQQKLDIEIPMGAIADGTTIEDIAGSVVQRIRKGADKGLSFTEESLIHQHMGGDDDAESVKSKLSDLRQAG